MSIKYSASVCFLFVSGFSLSAVTNVFQINGLTFIVFFGVLRKRGGSERASTAAVVYAGERPLF
ncbi:hypothetical protein DNK65_05380 [Citrobacter koseri]|nr:hypothetical protein DNK65_05380 [Citrobacter koseri]